MENLNSYKSRKLNELQERRAQKRRRKIRNKICGILCTVLLCTASFGTIYTVSAKEVTITEINEFAGVQNSIKVKTRKSEVMELLNEQGITVSDTDKLNVPTDAELTENGEIVVRRGKEIRVVTSAGDQTVVVTSADTEQALREAGYQPTENDEINLNGGSIAASDTVEIKTVSTAEETESIEIDFDTEYINDPDILEGEEKVTTEGEKGELIKVYQVSRYENGEEKERTLLKEETVKEPVKKVIKRGTKKKPVNTTAPSSTPANTPAVDTGSTIDGHKYSRVIEMNGTAYTDSPSENGGYSRTAMGTPLRRGVVAVDPKVIPLGTKVYVKAKDGSYVYGTAVAEDTGGAIKGNKIDLCIPSESEMHAFGRRQVLVYVLDE